ncbi:MAG: hypothetical protein JSS49_26615 [Planctomycetes bacterium]|nr:hypothetical protein [Planctomycetota bacterium]
MFHPALPWIGACLIAVLQVGNAAAQVLLVDDVLFDLRRAEQEEANAKQIRLRWIDEERSRIRSELTKYENELTELKKMVPDPIRPRIVPPAVARGQAREKLAFNDWASNNDPTRQAAILKGSGVNALLRVLGPIAHYRKKKSSAQTSTSVFPSLAESEWIQESDASHFRMVPATSSGSQVAVRLNQLPLDLQWPPVIFQNWQSDCKSILKLRDEYVALINSNLSDPTKHLNHAELLDSAIALLQAKVIHKKATVTKDPLLSDARKRNQVHRELQDALRYLETVRATAERFKSAPGDYKVHRFAGGNVEDFLDFCYTHGMIFQESRPADQEYYQKVFRRMQDYAHDVQYVEDWKSDLDVRISELSRDDKRLVWQAAAR